MGITDAKFIDDAGVTRFEGVIAGLVSADTINGVAINNNPSGAGEILETVDPANAHWIAAPGGGFTVGSSFLIADTIQQSGLASATPTPGQYALGSFAGADVAIDGMDNTKINIATTGFYAIAAYITVEIGTATGILRGSFSAQVNGSDLVPASDFIVTAGASLDLFTAELPAPAIGLTAGDVLGSVATVFTVAGAGTVDWDAKAASLWVVRLS